MLRGITRTVAIAGLPLLLLSGCSGDDGGSGGGDGGAAALLTETRAALDAASSVHFTLTSSGVPEGGTRLLGGDGVVARPPAFRGKLDVLVSGNKVSVELVSVGGTVYAKLPFAAGFAVTDPADFGLTDPAKLIDPATGISRIAREMSGATVRREARIDGDVVAEVAGEVPGTVIEEVLTSADPATPVKAVLFVVKETGQLRRAELTGPFFEAGKDSTFVVVLDRYGEKVSISAPPTG